MIRKSYHLLQDAIFGSIIYNMMDMEPYIQYLNRNDKTVEKATELYKEGKTKPTAPVAEESSKNKKKAYTSPIYAGSYFHIESGNIKSVAINISTKNDKKGNSNKHKA